MHSCHSVVVPGRALGVGMYRDGVKGSTSRKQVFTHSEPRFSEIEAIAVLTLFTLRYKIEVKEDPRFANETFEQRKARLLKLDALLTATSVCYSLQSRHHSLTKRYGTLSPLNVQLTFTRRD